MSGLHSPSASEDSVEVQVIPISLRNKRKLAEPRKIQEPSTAPLKKRRFEQIEETVVADEESRPARSPSPFRPWSSGTSNKSNETKTTTTSTTATTTASSITTTTTATTNGNAVSTIVSNAALNVREEKEEEEARRRQQEARIQEEVLLRLQESNRRPDSPIQARNAIPRRETRQRFEQSAPTSPPAAPLAPGIVLPTHPKFQEEPLALVLRGEIPRVPSHPAVSGTYERTVSSSYPADGHHHQQQSNHNHHHHNHHHPAPPHRQQSQQGPGTQQTNHSRHHQGSGGSGSGGGGGQQRNYKNMTRERRIEANARERTRVHTISAAFDTLRRAIPAYSHNQKLSKLSVLRIACSYIMTLSKIVNTPDGEPTTGASLGACVDLVSRTIQTEGKLRKRKDD